MGREIRRLRFKYRFAVLKPVPHSTYYEAFIQGEARGDDELSALLHLFGEKGMRIETSLPDGSIILQGREVQNVPDH